MAPSESGRCFSTAVPDLRVTIQELMAEGDKVALRRSYQGTHRAQLLGIPATGKPLQIGSISSFRLAGGRIAENWEQWDRLALMQQLGVVPAPNAPFALAGK